jgi:Leu/Phe-tRNA-protein transferase
MGSTPIYKKVHKIKGDTYPNNRIKWNFVQGGTITLRYTADGYLILSPHDDLRRMVDIMLETAYNREFCIAADFSPEFIARLMEAGFLVMSTAVQDGGEPFFILLPKLHLLRSALFFDNLHIKKSIRRHLELYELRPDADFEFILDRCVAIHGDDWLTKPLVDAIKKIRFLNTLALQSGDNCASPGLPDVFSRIRPASFALYRDGKLVAGEFGIIAGRVYTSYSGYYDEDNSGTVQLIKTTQYLRDSGFTFFDLGMPLDYKTGLGALDISPEEFVKLFREELFRQE